jgi:hypothetical protein
MHLGVKDANEPRSMNTRLHVPEVLPVIFVFGQMTICVSAPGVDPAVP